MTESFTAADILSSTHPLHKSFRHWLNDKEPTRRQARKFLSTLPNRGAGYGRKLKPLQKSKAA